MVSPDDQWELAPGGKCLLAPRALAAALLTLVWGALSLAEAHPPDRHAPVPPWQAASGWPDRVIATYADDPATTLSVTWRTDATIGRTIAQITEATSDTRFDLVAETYRADTERVDLNRLETPEGVRHTLENHGLGPVHYHSVTFEGLTPDTLYAWRVRGARGQWSEWVQTRTAPETGPVAFVYFGDAQNGIRSHWSRVIRMAQQTVPEANFFLHAGDLVDKGDSDQDWAEWFDAGGFIHAQIPSIPVPGNHENISVWPEGRTQGQGGRVRVRTTLWRPQFTLPVIESLPESLHESVYDIRYTEDLHIFVVDSARTEFEQQAAWLDEALSQSDAKWKIVTMHHPYFMPAAFDRRTRDTDRRRQLGPVIRRHDVAMVLTGHIHTYSRLTEEPQRGDNFAARRMTGTSTDVGTVYVVSSSGAKNSDLFAGGLAGTLGQGIGDGVPDYDDVSIDRTAGNTPMFQVIRIDGDQLYYEARTALGDVYDGFALTRSADGRLVLTEGPEAFGDTRLFSNTGPYQEWWDLQ